MPSENPNHKYAPGDDMDTIDRDEYRQTPPNKMFIFILVFLFLITFISTKYNKAGNDYPLSKSNISIKFETFMKNDNKTFCIKGSLTNTSAIPIYNLKIEVLITNQQKDELLRDSFPLKGVILPYSELPFEFEYDFVPHEQITTSISVSGMYLR